MEHEVGDMTLKERLTKYILSHPGINLDQLIEVAKGKGFQEAEILETLDKVHSDKRISYTANASGVVVYRPATTKVASTSHLTWLRDTDADGKPNYPRYDYDMPFPEIDMSWIVLSPEEMKKFKEEQNGGYRPKQYKRA